MGIYKYRSPYRPLPLVYLPEGCHFLVDHSDIGRWTPKTVYAFDTPIPDDLVKRWDLEIIE